MPHRPAVPGWPLPAVALVSLAATACAGADVTDRVVRRDSGGVHLVTSPATDVAAPFELHEEWRVGGMDGELELAEILPWHVAADAAGAVYILDEVGRRVFVLDEAGMVADTLGRPGEGPGELATPVSIHVAADGTVGVWDYGQGGLVRWRSGEVLPIQRVSEDFWGADVRMIDGRVAFVTMEQDDVVRLRLVLADSAESQALAEMERPRHAPAEFPTCGIRGIPIPPLFAVELNWESSGDRVFASTSADYEIRVIDLAASDSPTMIWRRALPARAATEAMALREVGDGLRIPVNGCTVPPMEVVRGRGYGDRIPAVGRLVADRAGHVWVLRGGLGWRIVAAGEGGS